MVDVHPSFTDGNAFELNGSGLHEYDSADLLSLTQNVGRSPAFSDPQLEIALEQLDLWRNRNGRDALGGFYPYHFTNSDGFSEDTDRDILLGDNEIAVFGGFDGYWRSRQDTLTLGHSSGGQMRWSVDDPQFDADLQASLERSLEDGNSPGSIAAVSTGDGQLWTGATGLADVENETPAMVGDRFPAASVTKPFTAAVVMQLAEEAVLSLEDTMDQWLPDTVTDQIANSDTITIRQLLSHTSGVNSTLMSDEYLQDLVEDPSLIFQDWTPTELLSRYVYDRAPSFAPGNDVEYNSANYLLLGLIIEAATDSTLTTQFRERIIDPLDLNNTFMPDEDIPGGYQPGYIDLDGDGTFDLNAEDADLERFGGAGALVSTVEDLARFSQALFEGELVSSDALQEMITGGVTISTEDPLVPEVGVGLGFGYQDVIGEGRHFFANGDSYGWTVRLRYDRETETTTVVYRNGVDQTATEDYADQALNDLLVTTRDYQSAPQYGTEENEKLTGTPKPDRIYGLEGRDRLLGRAGSDSLSGGEGDDRLYGKAGLDWLNGGAGRDRLYGGVHRDYLIGGLGNDDLVGGKGYDTLKGQAGDDDLRGGMGNDQLDGGAGWDTLRGHLGDDVLINLDGGILTGGQGNDDFRLGDGRLPDTPKITIFPPLPDFTITDFTVGEDQLTLNFGITFDDLIFLDTEAGTIISTELREGLILLEGVGSEDLTEDNFDFGNAELQAAFQADLNQVLTESGFPGMSISVMAPDGSNWTRAQGVSDLENETPLTTDDRFVVGSVTKVFTATAILQLVEEGRLGLDDPMSQWLPEISERIPNGDRITVRQLLGHTSGIRDDGGDLAEAYLENPDIAQREWTPEDFLELIYDKEPMGEPGEFGYSNPNYTLLGEIVEAVTGTDLEQEFQTRFFQPLGLQDTFYAYPEDIPGGYVKSYYDETGDGNFEDILSGVHPSLSFKKAAGGLVSTPTDLNQFARALFSGALLSPALLGQMVGSGNPFLGNFKYGLGAMYDNAPDVGRVQGHDGAQSLFGWRANMYHLPDLNMTLSITTNGFTDAADPVGDLWIRTILNTVEQAATSSVEGEDLN
ncbi:serine hydrolase [Vacuolonema iberomarrocanum]|uniref:serine hydrolase n=1 Tax=Vacuolonema iberomarrocanum TaxID=3454632 RepID=UPI001A107C13|nr:serine hydrolase [filamentous cyanobacterium LEGE 07170]